MKRIDNLSAKAGKTLDRAMGRAAGKIALSVIAKEVGMEVKNARARLRRVMKMPREGWVFGERERVRVTALLKRDGRKK